jgi:hypothetical protein
MGNIVVAVGVPLAFFLQGVAARQVPFAAAAGTAGFANSRYVVFFRVTILLLLRTFEGDEGHSVPCVVDADE